MGWEIRYIRAMCGYAGKDKDEKLKAYFEKNINPFQKVGQYLN